VAALDPPETLGSLESRHPLTGPMSSGVRNRQRVEASEDSRSSVHAHPVFRSLWLHIGSRCAPDTHLDQVRTHRPANERLHRTSAHSSSRYRLPHLRFASPFFLPLLSR